MFPFSISNTQEGMPGPQTITFDKIDMNIDIDDARFAFPK
jgi:hypothetical protein